MTSLTFFPEGAGGKIPADRRLARLMVVLNNGAVLHSEWCWRTEKAKLLHQGADIAAAARMWIEENTEESRKESQKILSAIRYGIPAAETSAQIDWRIERIIRDAYYNWTPILKPVRKPRRIKPQERWSLLAETENISSAPYPVSRSEYRADIPPELLLDKEQWEHALWWNYPRLPNNEPKVPTMFHTLP